MALARSVVKAVIQAPRSAQASRLGRPHGEVGDAAALGRPWAAQSNLALQPTARVSSCERSNERARRS
jgi:hypothetical protein